MNPLDLLLKEVGLKKNPGNILVFKNDEDNSLKVYSGEYMLMDYFDRNHNKVGTLSLCSVDDIKTAEKKILNSDNPDLSKISGIELDEQFFSPEINFCITQDKDGKFDYKNFTYNEVREYINEYFYDYRLFLNEKNIVDIDRNSEFINAAMIDERVFDVLYEKEKTKERWIDQLGKTNFQCISRMPKDLATFDTLFQVNYEDPKYAYLNLPNHITGEQMVKFIEKDRKSNKYNETHKLTKCILSIPDKFKTGELISELHKKYDNSPLKDELAYTLVVSGIEVNSENAKTAMEYFSSVKFMTDYDPIGADDSWGQVCGCEYYLHPYMSNPIEKIDPNLLSITEWHDIASQNTRMMEFIPKEVINNESFWNNYEDFIGKGDYLNHPSNEYKMDNFDEYEVFAKMPEQLKTDTDILHDLLERKVVSIDFITNPTEEQYLLVDPKDYERIPESFREKDNFRNIAIAAFEKDNWNITSIPEKFITKEMVSSALSYDMELASRIPKHFLSEDMLVDKVKNSSNQGVLNDISKSGEHPDSINLDISDHKTVLQYIPEELKTDKVCEAALAVNKDNAVYLPDSYKGINETVIKSAQIEQGANNTLQAGVSQKDEILSERKQGLSVSSQIENNKYQYLLDQLEKYHINPDTLREKGILDELIKGQKSSELIAIPVSVANTEIIINARLQLKQTDEKLSLTLFPQKRSLEEVLEKPFMGHSFSREQKGNLLALGNAGNIITITDENGSHKELLVSVDKLTNDLVAVEQKDIKIPDWYKNIQLTNEQKTDLLNGKCTLIRDVKAQDSISFSGLIQYNAEKQGVELLQYGLSVSKINEIQLNPKQKEDLSEGKTILMPGLVDGAGQLYNAWVRLDMKNRTLEMGKETPAKEVSLKKEIIPGQDFRVQVKHNTEGTKTEENKHIHESLKSGQNTKPHMKI